MKLYKYISILLLISSLFSDSISGKITDKNGKPIRKVNITFYSSGTTTDKDGFFFIDANPGVKITINHIGYESKILTLESNFTLIILNPVPIARKTIIVESGFKNISLLDSPSSLTVVDINQIVRNEDKHFQTFVNSISNLSWTGGTSRPRYYHIRGIGEAELYSGQGASNFSVGFTIDNVDMSGIGMPAMLFDMKQIEIFKGPQSSVYGSNSMAGLVSMESNDAVSYYESKGLFTVGNEKLQYGAIVNTPIANNFNYRLSLLYSIGKGFRKNTFLDKKNSNTNERQESLMRHKIKWSPNRKISFSISSLLSNQDNGYDVWSPTNNQNLEVLSNDPGKDSQKTFALSLKTLFKTFELFDLFYLTSYSNNNIDYYFDGDWGNNDYWASPPYSYNEENQEFFGFSEEGCDDGEYDKCYYDWIFNEKSHRTRKTFTNELRIKNKTNSSSNSKYTFGVYMKNMTESDSASGYLMGGDISLLEAEFKHKNIAAYLELSRSISNSIKIDANLRLEKSILTYSGYTLGYYPDFTTFKDTLSHKKNETLIGFKASLSFKMNPNNLFYLSLSRGYKPGGINQHPYISSDRRYYESEYNLNTELGYKIFKDKYILSVSLFYMIRNNQQNQHAIQSAQNPIAYSYFTANAKNGYNYGLEMDSQYLITKNLIIASSLGLLKSWVDSYPLLGQNYGERETSNSPSYTYNLSLTYKTPWSLTWVIDCYGKDSFYFSPDHNQIIDGYSLVDASVSYKLKNTSITLWGKNLMDKRYSVKSFYFSLNPVEALATYEQNIYNQWGDPIEYGLTIQFEF